MPDDVSTYLDVEERKNFGFTSCKVTMSKMREIFGVLKDMFQKVPFSKVIAIEVKNHKLTFSASLPAIYYKAAIDTPIDANCRIVVSYQEILDILYGTGECTVTVSPSNVLLDTDITSATLKASMENVVDVCTDSNYYTILRADVVSRGLTKLLQLNAYSNVFTSNVTTLLNGDYMQIKYPTLWAQVPCNEVSTLIDIRTAKVVQHFLDTDDVVHYTIIGNTICFRKDNTWLSVARGPVESNEDLIEYSKNFDFLGTCNIDNLRLRVKDMCKCSGKGESLVVFYDDGASLMSSREYSVLSTKFGHCKAELTHFSIDLSMLDNILSIVGNNFDIYKREDTLCLRNEKTLAVFSYHV